MNDKLTIGLFTDSFFPMVDGVAMVVDNYAKRLTKYARVIVFAPLIIGREVDDSIYNYEVVRCRSLKVPFIDYSLPVPKMDRGFIKELNQYHLDIVHIHSPFTVGEAGINYARKHHIPVVGTMHSQYKQDFMRAVHSDYLASKLNNQLIRVFNKCDECWAVNREVARIFFEEYGYKTLPKVMNNATEMKPVKNFDVSLKKVNDKYHLKKEKVFLFVGRINNLKNVFFIVDVLKKVRELKPSLTFKMLFVGTGQDEEELKKRITDNDLGNYVIMCGKILNRDLLAGIYARSDLFLFPSLYDASSIVQIEAASQKTPGLFLKGSATSATVSDNINGFLCDEDVSLYAKKIISILDNPSLLKEVSENAYRDLYKNWDNVIEEVYEKYLDLIKSTS